MGIEELIYDFSAEKNQQLIKERGVSFEDAIAALNNGRLLDTIGHHNLNKYPHQKIYVIEVNHYAYLVPFVKTSKKEIFLKTIFPSRKLTKKYLKNEEEQDD